MLALFNTRIALYDKVKKNTTSFPSLESIGSPQQKLKILRTPSFFCGSQERHFVEIVLFASAVSGKR
jgi:hypothetical protein